MNKRMNRSIEKNRREKELSLGSLIFISVVFHAVVFAVFALMPSSGKADDLKKPRAMMFNLDVADQLGSGLGMTPQKGPVHDGVIDLPDQPPEPETIKPKKEPTTRKPKAVKKPRKKKPRKKSPKMSDMVLDAVKRLNEGREGEFTRPDGDPNSANPGPAGPVGGDACAVYRKRSSRYIRRSGSVPEAAGRSARISVSIGPSGAVTSKRLTKSTGVPHADSIAMGAVPGRFGAPPPECGTVSIRVTVNFQGKKQEKMPERETRKKKSPKKKKANVPSAIDRALRDLD